MKRQGNELPIPIGQRLRREESTVNTSTDIDDEIQRLEAELANEEESSTSSSSSDDDDIVNLSTVQDRIQPLPAASLPTISRQKSSAPGKQLTLDPAVLESVRPRLPFYCRPCATQFANLQEWEDHRATDAHKEATRLERKASYCKLCRKQLTSPLQLKEHLKSRPHRERLDRMRGTQSSRRQQQQQPPPQFAQQRRHRPFPPRRQGQQQQQQQKYSHHQQRRQRRQRRPIYPS